MIIKRWFKVISKFSKKQSNHNVCVNVNFHFCVQSYLKIFKEAIKSQHVDACYCIDSGSKLSQNFQRSNQITTQVDGITRTGKFKVISKFSKKQSNHNLFAGIKKPEWVQSYLKIFKEAIKSQPVSQYVHGLHCSKLSQNFQRSNQITTHIPSIQALLPFKVISKFSKKQSNHNPCFCIAFAILVQSYLKIFKEAIKSQPT